MSWICWCLGSSDCAIALCTAFRFSLRYCSQWSSIFWHLIECENWTGNKMVLTINCYIRKSLFDTSGLLFLPCWATRASICLSSSRVHGTGPFPPWDSRKNVYRSLHFPPSLSIVDPIPCQLISSSALFVDRPCFLFRKAFFRADTTDFNFLSCCRRLKMNNRFSLWDKTCIYCQNQNIQFDEIILHLLGSKNRHSKCSLCWHSRPSHWAFVLGEISRQPRAKGWRGQPLHLIFPSRLPRSWLH